jgi:hypothetical protein
MGNRFFCSRIPSWGTFSQLWPSAHTGRYWKRQLSKARRRFGKQLCRDGDVAYSHMRGLKFYERIVNWKTW